MIVIGEGSITVSPNYAQIRSGVTTDAKTVKEASDGNTKLMSYHYAGADRFRDCAKGHSDVTIFNRTDLHVAITPRAAEPKLSGYRVANQVTVTLHQISQVGEILDRLIKAGATDVGNVSLSRCRAAKSRSIEAREAALADARHKAELYARAVGVRLGPVAWITETLM